MRKNSQVPYDPEKQSNLATGVLQHAAVQEATALSASLDQPPDHAKQIFEKQQFEHDFSMVPAHSIRLQRELADVSSAAQSTNSEPRRNKEEKHTTLKHSARELYQLAARPHGAMSEWSKLNETEQQNILYDMSKNYGEHFVNQFRQYASGQMKPDTTVEVTNQFRESAFALQWQGFQFAVDSPGYKEVWVHPSGKELWRIKPKPPDSLGDYKWPPGGAIISSGLQEDR